MCGVAEVGVLAVALGVGCVVVVLGVLVGWVVLSSVALATFRALGASGTRPNNGHAGAPTCKQKTKGWFGVAGWGWLGVWSLVGWCLVFRWLSGLRFSVAASVFR